MAESWHKQAYFTVDVKLRDVAVKGLKPCICIIVLRLWMCSKTEVKLKCSTTWQATITFKTKATVTNVANI